MEDGLTSEESIIISRILEEVGIDVIEVSGGNDSSKYVSCNQCVRTYGKRCIFNLKK